MVVGTSRGSTIRKIVFLQIVSCHILARDVFEYVRLFFVDPLFQKYTSETSPVTNISRITARNFAYCHWAYPYLE